MPSDYESIAEKNIKKYGTDIDRYGPVILANLYSDRTHFVYEILQNTEDACERARKADEFCVSFKLSPGRLEARHNGILFDGDDVRGICGLVEGTKNEDLTQIGKFGIGFKSVYAYTSSPEIYSGNEAFLIEDYVHPRGIKKVDIKDNETLFVFPFNHKNVSPEQAFEDISKRLHGLGSQTLLFLNNINEIGWEIDGGESGTYIRDPKPQSGHSKRIYIISKVGKEEDKSEEWLIFDRPVKTENPNASNLKVEVAYKICRENKDEKDTIIPVNTSHLVVFFPTEKETHLRFLIQGAYKTTPARDNIPKEDAWNKKLIKETARLVADSITMVKKMGLLTVDFLNVLPISGEDFPEDDMFRPIYDAVLDKLKSDEKLLPANDGGYISAKQAFLARGRDLIDLLGTEQLSLLFGKQDAHWLDSNITEASSVRNYLDKELEIPVIRPETFANRLDEEFMGKQTDEWVIEFYRFLLKHEDLW
ncbi:MAG: molecular chaperone of HSP90 family protein, partial [Planctomycetaceae bacterium]